MNQQGLNEWLAKLHSEVQQTNHSYPHNLIQGWPIPFFGDLIHARVLTVGVNPSDREFNPKRRWNEVNDLDQWQGRLTGYFENKAVPPWIWFETWAICLKLIDLGYAPGEAAHIDISPRPTSPMLAPVTDKAEFRRMAEHDVRWFFDLLGQLPRIQLLLVAGPIPRADGTKQQLAAFIREQASVYGAEWMDSEPLPRLMTRAHPKGIPVFVCRFEPELDGLHSMIRQVYQSFPALRALARPPLHLTPIVPARLDWPSAIGSFLLSFGTLEYFVFVFLKDHLPEEEFQKVKEWHLKDRVARIRQRLKDTNLPMVEQCAFERMIERLEPLRELRNHLAHGHMNARWDPVKDTASVMVLQAKDVDKEHLPDTRNLEFRELLAAIGAIGELNQEFQRFAGFKPE